MSRLARNRWFLLACVVVFSLGGIALVLGGDADAQVAGWTSLLFFGVGLGSAVTGQFVAGHPRPLERSRVQLPNGSQASAMVLAYPRYPPILRTIAGVGLVAGCAVFALAPRVDDGGRFDDPGTRAIMGLVAVFFAVATVLRFQRGSPGPDTIGLTARGLLVSAAGASRYVPWTSVRSVERRDLRGNPMLAVVTHSPDAIIRSGGAGLLDTIGAVLVGTEQVPIALNNLALPPDKVTMLVQGFLAHARDDTHDASIGESDDTADPVWFDQLRESATAS